MDAHTAEESLRLIADTISEVVWIGTLDLSRLFYVSPAYEQVWGRSCESLYQNPSSFLEAVHPDDIERVQHHFAKQKEGLPFDLEYRIVRPDGIRWIWDRAYPLRNEAGMVDRSVGVARDITERKRIERELATTVERFHLVTRGTNDAIWDWDVVTNVAWWSDNVYDDLGFDRNVAPNYEAWVDRVHPEDRPRVLAAFARAMEDPKIDTWTEEYRFLIPGGPDRHVMDRTCVLRDGTGRPVRMLGAMMNVTAQRNLEAQLRQAQKMEAVGLLAGGIAHDFNNLLQVLSLQLSLLADASGRPRATPSDLEEIRATVERAGNLTRQLLVYSRRQPVRLRWIDLNSVVADLVRMLSRILGEDISLRLELAPGTVNVYADAAIISQVIVNLVINAREAMPRGGTLAIVSSVVERDGGDGRKAGSHACLSVTDNGAGISPEVLPRIFEPFFTTKEPDRGTGLGLAITLGIVEQHGGFIEVDTVVGRGTTFRTYLPIGAAEPVPASSDVVAAPPPSARGKATILLVEDDVRARQLTRVLLERRGYCVIEAETGPAALRAWDQENGRIDLVLTDICMPGGMDGIELARLLTLRRPELKLIFATGNSPKFSPDGPENRHMLLHKPIKPEELLHSIEACLHNGLDQA